MELVLETPLGEEVEDLYDPNQESLQHHNYRTTTGLIYNYQN
jgi:hypothetical protein